jgi:mannose-6-phosphate isomerase-like protein (cupin superfamily)
VVDGELLIDLEGAETITLDRHQACSMPKGVVHRMRAPRRTTILMVEGRVRHAGRRLTAAPTEKRRL